MYSKMSGHTQSAFYVNLYRAVDTQAQCSICAYGFACIAKCRDIPSQHSTKIYIGPSIHRLNAVYVRMDLHV